MHTTCSNQTGSHIDSRLIDKLGETSVGTLLHPRERGKENVPNLEAVELFRLKKELEAAKERLLKWTKNYLRHRSPTILCTKS